MVGVGHGGVQPVLAGGEQVGVPGAADEDELGGERADARQGAQTANGIGAVANITAPGGEAGARRRPSCCS